MSNNITYEQFELLCKQYNMTIDEGYRAMCFAHTVINRNLANKSAYAHKIINTDNNYSDRFKQLAQSWKENAVKLSVDYAYLETDIYNMLEKHDEETKWRF